LGFLDVNDSSSSFDPLNEDELRAAGADKAQGSASEKWTPITPIPEGASPFGVRLRRKTPERTWVFRDREGRALGIECRWMIDGKKQIRFATWCRDEHGSEAWRLRHLPAPRPIFGLDTIAKIERADQTADGGSS
jgi:hypothetical protein